MPARLLPPSGVQPAAGWSARDLLRLLGSLERGSSHPLAAAVLGYAAAQVRHARRSLEPPPAGLQAARLPADAAIRAASLHGRPLPFFQHCTVTLSHAVPQGAVCDAAVDGLEVVPGAGLVAMVEGWRVAAGTAGLLELHAGVSGPEVAAAQRAVDAEGAHSASHLPQHTAS